MAQSLIAGQSGPWTVTTFDSYGHQCDYCDSAATVIMGMTRYRWSKSANRHKVQQVAEYLCDDCR